MKPLKTVIADYYQGRATKGAVLRRVNVAPDVLRHYVDQYAPYITPAPDSGETRQERARYYAGVALESYLAHVSQ